MPGQHGGRPGHTSQVLGFFQSSNVMSHSSWLTKRIEHLQTPQYDFIRAFCLHVLESAPCTPGQAQEKSALRAKVMYRDRASLLGGGHGCARTAERPGSQAAAPKCHPCRSDRSLSAKDEACPSLKNSGDRRSRCKRRDSTVKQPCGHAEIHCKQHIKQQHDLWCNEYRKTILVSSLSCTCS